MANHQKNYYINHNDSIAVVHTVMVHLIFKLIQVVRLTNFNLKYIKAICNQKS